MTEILPGLVRTDFAATRTGDPEPARGFCESFGTNLDLEDIARAVVIPKIVMVPNSQG